MQHLPTARLEMIPQESQTPEQAQVCAEVISGPRGKIPAPMIAWLRNAELARRGQRVGELLRFQTTLEPRLTELAILVCARHWTSHHEWTAHKALALQAGLHPRAVAAIAAREPLPDGAADEQLVFRVAQSLLTTGTLAQSLYDAAVNGLGEIGVVELVSVLGYYCWVSFTLNAFQLGMPGSIAPELKDPALSPAFG